MSSLPVTSHVNKVSYRHNSNISLRAARNSSRSTTRSTIMSSQDDPSSIHSSSNDSGNKYYMSKKTIAQGMFDVALLSSNTNQLVHLLEMQYESEKPASAFHVTAIVLLIMSIVLQVIVGGCLIVIAMSNTRIPTKKIAMRRLNNFATVLIFLITVLNVLIPPFTPSYSISKS